MPWPPPPLTRPRAVALAAGLMLVLGLGRSLWPKDAGGPARPPVPVVATTVRRGTITVTYPLTGEVRAVASAAIRPEVTGILQRVLYRQGQEVQAGQPLLVIDPAPFQAALNQAIANRQKAAAMVLEAEAEARRSQTQARTARLRADRYQRLGSQGAVSRDQEEQFRSDADSLDAGVSRSRSEIVSARADLAAAAAAEAAARLRWQRTVVRSPIAGRAGQLRVTLGNSLREGQEQALLVVNQFEPIEVLFALPQRLLPRLRTGLRVDLEGGQRGAITTLDNAVDPGTGTTAVKATFANGNRQLVPGQFVKGKLSLERLHGVLLIPQTAIQNGQHGPFVYVVTGPQAGNAGPTGKAPGNRAQVRPLQLGPSADGLVAVERGLAAGEQVVSQGQFALSPGARITLGGPRR